MRRPGPWAAGLAVLAGLAFPLFSAPPRFSTWRLEAGSLVADAPDLPIAVGSLQKPFVARAWAQAHAGLPSPRFTCGPGDRCWFRPGHGELGLVRATALSCNTYYRRLAADTPLEELGAALGAEGFAPAPADPEDAIGLSGSLAIRPSALLEAYVRLTRIPWPDGEAIRLEVLAGMREAALDGTAKGLGHRGFWAKTGTVPLDPVHTQGLALAVDDTGWAILGRLDPGTGREAARALAAEVDRLRPGTPRIAAAAAVRPPARAIRAASAPDPVRVRLFELLGRKRFLVRNLGPGPVPAGNGFQGGFLGAGATRELRRGDRVGPGLLELSAPGTPLVRRIQGTVSRPGPVLARVSLREYVSGVLAGELPGGSPALRTALGAAVLRFLAHGPRHADADVCDSTHCAHFIGRGPVLDWKTGARTEVPALDDGAWEAIQIAARHPGPDHWTAHCGGRPLSPRFVWGSGSGQADPCPNHAYPTAPWTRFWPSAALARAFGAPVRGLQVTTEDGTWSLRVTTADGTRTLRYDDAHRRLAAVLGWDALPSPADRAAPAPGGFRVTGVGYGHRVGLCLGLQPRREAVVAVAQQAIGVSANHPH